MVTNVFKIPTMSREAVDIRERVLFSCQRSPSPVTTKEGRGVSLSRQAVTLNAVRYTV